MIGISTGRTPAIRRAEPGTRRNGKVSMDDAINAAV